MWRVTTSIAVIALLAAACPTSSSSSSVRGTKGIGDRVWLDVDCNGLQDPGEPGLDDVLVRLRDASLVLVDQQRTAEGGRYFFSGIGPGEYWIEVDETTLLPGLQRTECMVGSDRNKDNDCSPAYVELSQGQTVDRSVDFGYADCGGSIMGIIGDRVWHDTDHDGIQDAGEPGLEDVRIDLVPVAGGSARDTLSGPGGDYFFEGLPAGQYMLTVDESTLPPLDFEQTPCEQGTDPVRDNNCSPVVVDLPAAALFDPTIDFGYATPHDGSLGDFVWHDVNCDGIQDPGELGIDGVSIELFDESGAPLMDVTTSGGGRYGFPGLPAGTYEVRVDETTLPANFYATLPEQGSDPERDSNGSPAMVFLAAEIEDRSIDFGYCSDVHAMIGDFIWNDANKNGIQDSGEDGLADIDVRLFDDAGTEIRFFTTGGDGLYGFTGLGPGTYRVEVDEHSLPPSFVASPCNVGSNDEIDNDCSPVLVTLVNPMQVVDDVDFGYHATEPGSIGDFVWLDEDGDGIQDHDEKGIEDVRVLLFDGLGVHLATDFTDIDGEYGFGGLSAGTYIVEVDESTLPEGLTASPCNAGNDDTRDNDCSPVTVELAPGEEDDTVDFGYTEEEESEGCSPEFWRSSQNFPFWPAPYQPATPFSDVFEDAFPGDSFVDVLELNGGGLQALGRHTVAAFLNAQSPDVDYELTASDVVQLFNDVYPGTNAEYYSVRLYLSRLNERHCPLD